MEIVEQEPTGEKCPTCGKDMFVKRGRFGRYVACTDYPECKTSQPFTFGVHCPKCVIGLLGEKRSRRGKYFYGCTRWKAGTKDEKGEYIDAPDSCDYVSWYKPIKEHCPQCDSLFLTERWTRKTGTYKACPNKECGYKLIPEEPVGDVPDMGGPAEI